MSQVIEAHEVEKSFGAKAVLRRFSLSVPQGCVFALLGENGVGKTTFLRGLMGYLRFDRGQVSVLGMSPEKETLQLRRRVGYISDSPAFYEWMTVIEVARFTAAFYKPTFAGNFLKWANRFELPANTKVNALSKGMRSKLALALMVAAEPELMILDEPTSGLDPVVRRSFLESMVDVAASGRTVLIASHQLHEIERVAEQVAFMKDGEVIATGDLDQLKGSIASLTFSRRDSLLSWPGTAADIEVLSESHAGRTSTYLVRGLSDELVTRIRDDANIMEVEVNRPSLEELYVGLSVSRRTDRDEALAN